MRASIENFQKIPLGSRSQRVLILGDMLELGEWSQQEHTEIIRLALSAEDVHIHLVGNEFARAYAAMAEFTQQGRHATSGNRSRNRKSRSILAGGTHQGSSNALCRTPLF